MSTIDAHVHLYPPELNRDPKAWAHAQGEPRWAELCVRRRKDGRAVQSFPSVDELLKKMDAAEVERAVLLGWYWERAATCEMQNQFYARCVREHPDRLSAFATVQPGDDPARAVVQLQQSREAGLIGLGELSPHAQGYAMDSEAFQATLALASKWSWPVNLHVTDPLSGNYPGRVETPLEDFRRLARAWPTVKFILAHWGGGLAWEEGMNAPEFAHVYFDTAASPLLCPPTVWTRAAGVVGVRRILFGTDFPLNLYPRSEPEAEMKGLVTEAKTSGLGEPALSAILAGNARQLIY